MRTLLASLMLVLGACSFAPAKPDDRLPLPPGTEPADAGPSAAIPAEGGFAPNGLKLYAMERPGQQGRGGD